MRWIAVGTCLLVLGFGLFSWSTAEAQNNTPATNTQTNTPANNTAPGNQVRDRQKGVLDFKPPVKDNFPQLFSRFINIMLALIAFVATIFIVVGGFQLAFSQGKAEAATAGKKTITWAVAGLIIALLAFAIVNIVDRLIFPK